MIHGIDVSSHQSATGYALAARDAFVFVKATEGSTYANPSRAAQVARARAAGRVVGHYHWLHPSNIAAQAAWFAAKANVQPGDLIAIDWENDPDGKLGKQVSEADKDLMIRELRKRYPRNRIVVYTYTYYGPHLRAGTGTDYGDGLWIADYRGPTPTLPWLFWQYSDNPFDQNWARFPTPQALRDWASFTQPAPPEGLDMATAAFIFEKTTKPQYLDIGENVVKINDDGDLSIVVGANEGIDVVATLDCGQLVPGVEAFFRVVDYSPEETVKYSDRYRISFDAQKQQFIFKGPMKGTVAAGHSLRLRLIVNVPDSPDVNPGTNPSGPGAVSEPNLRSVQVTGWKM